MSDYPMLISNKLHSFRNFRMQIYNKYMKFFRITGYGYNYTIGWHLLKIIE